jgi:hypothetical protein
MLWITVTNMGLGGNWIWTWRMGKIGRILSIWSITCWIEVILLSELMTKRTLFELTKDN